MNVKVQKERGERRRERATLRYFDSAKDLRENLKDYEEMNGD